MPLIMNGVDIPEYGGEVIMNGTSVDTVIMNGVTVWEKLVFNGIWSGHSKVVVLGFTYGLDVSGSTFRMQGYNSSSAENEYGIPINVIDSGGTVQFDNAETFYTYGSGTESIVAGGNGNSTGPNKLAHKFDTTPSTGEVSYEIGVGFTGSSLDASGVTGLETSGGQIRYIKSGVVGPWITLT